MLHVLPTHFSTNSLLLNSFLLRHIHRLCRISDNDWFQFQLIAGFFQNGLLYKIAQFQHIVTSCLAGIDHEAGMLYAHLCIADAGTFQTALVDQK